jgi:DNA-binding NtrC family response regulator
MHNLENEMNRKRILIVCLDVANRQVIENAIGGWMLETIACLSLNESRVVLAKQEVDVIFCEDCFEGGTYRDLLDIVRHRTRRVPVVLIVSEMKREALYPEAIGLGVFDALASPCSKKDVQWMTIQAVESVPATHKSRGLRA